MGQSLRLTVVSYPGVCVTCAARAAMHKAGTRTLGFQWWFSHPPRI